MPQLALELDVTFEAVDRQAARLDRFAHCAARLLLMGTVREAAVTAELLDVVEGPTVALIGAPELDFTQARAVDDQGAARQREQLAVGGGVLTRLSVARTAPVRCKSCPASQLSRVDLPGSG